MLRPMTRISFLIGLTLALNCAVSAQNYSFRTIDFPGAAGTYLAGINDSGKRVGNYNFTDPNAYDPSFGFEMSNGIFKAMKFPGIGVAGFGAGEGVLGEDTGSSGAGVFGLAPSTTGPTNGVAGFSESAAGTGVYGFASSSTGNTIGVNGVASSPTGTACLVKALV